MLRPLLAALAFVTSAFAATDFRADIAPLLEKSCVSCHGSGAHLNLSSRKAMIDSKALVPGNPNMSTVYTTVMGGTMPPNGKLSPGDIGKIQIWIAEGAQWPPDYTLKTATQSPAAVNRQSSAKGSELDTVRQIRERIIAHEKEKGQAQSYQVKIPNTIVSYEMKPVPRGEYLMGSNAKDAAPQHKVKVDPFWMQAHEVTWDEYRLFMFANQAGDVAGKDTVVDGVSRPTRPYVEMSFGMGINGFPAISMTQHAANKYAEWLSSKTGEFYRLPTEAEWEYACRAGTQTDYYFGNDASQLGEYAVFSADSGGKYSKVGTKKPNSWGLYDMLGNVMEWTLDAYAPYKAGNQANPWTKTTRPYPIAARGGSWNDAADRVQCASRVASDPSWKQQDPQLPKSIWYETDAQWLGFRLVRPAAISSAEEMFKYWNNGVEHDEQ